MLRGAGGQACGRATHWICAAAREGAYGARQRLATMDMLPQCNSDYLQREYWEQRFEAEEEYEWFRGCVARARLLHVRVRPRA